MRAARRDVARRHPARESLCRTYSPPIYRSMRRRGHSPADADRNTWSPKILFVADPNSPTRTWDAKRDFGPAGNPPIPLTPLAALAHVLLRSNALACVD